MFKQVRFQDKKASPKKRGQSTLEYIVLVAAVIAAIIIFTTGTFRNAVSNTWDQGTQGMTNMAGRLANSHVTPP